MALALEYICNNRGKSVNCVGSEPETEVTNCVIKYVLYVVVAQHILMMIDTEPELVTFEPPKNH